MDFTTEPQDGRNFVNAPLHSLTATKRQAQFELLRIICMILIVASHFLGHGGWGENMQGANGVFGKLLQSVFLPSVNLFVMISAYFSCASQRATINFRRIFRLWLQVEFYSLLLFTVFAATETIPFSADWLLQSLFPFFTGKYWFFSSYAVMTVFSPFINVMLRNLTKRQHLTLCVVLLVFAGITGDAHVLDAFPTATGYNALWFCCLYAVTAYLRFYDVRLTRRQTAICAVLYIITLIAGIFISFHYTSVTVSLSSVFLFLVFGKIRIRSEKISSAICLVSSLTFGIYLLHDSPELRAYMYQNIFHSSELYGSKAAFLILTGFILLTFTVCATAEFARQRLGGAARACASATFRRLTAKIR